MRVYRSKFIMIAEYSSMDSKTALLWTVLQCHRHMREFMVVRFQGHPVIVKEMSLFMLTERVDPHQIERLNQRVVTAEARAATAASTAAGIEGQLGSSSAVWRISRMRSNN
jgi:hypothetical protein